MTPKLSELSIPERYSRVADRFGETVAGVADWDAPTPVAEWRTRDVVRHLAEWLPPMLGGGSAVVFEPVPSADDDPSATWRELDRQVRAILADAATAGLEFSNPNTGAMPVAETVDRFFTADVFMHTWDLARASGQDDALDAEHVAGLLEGFTGIEEMLRASGQFGVQQPVADDASVQERFIAFIGRDPHWAP